MVRFTVGLGLTAQNIAWPADRGFWIYRDPFDDFLDRMLIIHQPSDETFQPFEAEGLTMGGRHTWRYEFQYHVGEGF